ncbi:replication fork protection complex subunit Tof1/Swi1 [Geosmithia morbida]|uniref:Topoisomerase 1-associated factor 1 n=1 Tax=Geosmithia morbida TaxID=1094350 RepID=A0A9P4YRV8_9HYPO|nr:replication fork protection complex subunit Tof1/Swi1 [Geosmithia morbida]KAF4120491.1 replication fork protection complex subunit Tof1/Swi1 [Geosmithia morbida]
MEVSGPSVDIVHPEVRAYINSLVSALGGVSADDDGRYQLGDDALEVLRDIKRWIRFYDEKTNRMDVARCIYEANLIGGDLLPILATWPENDMDSKFKSRLALACYEVMVPLTWPMERDRERMTVNHHRHMPVLELAQVAYKQAIINYDSARVLHTAVRVALPSMALPIGDRTQRDQGVIKLVLFFLRNVASISPPPGVKYDGDETQVSRSATIDAFSYQDIFHLLLTLASNMGDEFRNEDATVMEIIYHLVKRVDIEQMFMDEQQLHRAKADELSTLMKKEEAMLKSHSRPSRHNRFGTMIWMKREDGRMTTLTGQDAISDSATRQRKMDSTKTFKPPRRGKKEDKLDREMGPAPKLDSRANQQLRSFVEDLLDAGFNPLFSHVRKSIDREASYLMQYHRRQFFYLVAWFLEAERMRRKSKKESRPAGGAEGSEEVTSFNLVAGVLNQEMFITLNKAMHESYEYKDWHELAAVMRCFTQILLTVQEMMQCGNEDDEEIAENTLSRLFYEETTHDMLANIIRTYKDQGFDYLDAATELLHHFLRILEAYSKQNVDMQVRSRKRTRRKKKAAGKKKADGEAGDGDDDGGAEEDDDDGSGEDDTAAAEKASKERKFDFHRFSMRFTSQGVVDTFVTYAKYYRDLSEPQLKRAHRFFYRLAFKQDMSVMLFRVDIIHLLHKMIKGPEPLDRSAMGSSAFREWEELVKQILRKCTRKIEERPELLVEMLFSKLQSTAYFLEYGYEKQTVSGGKAQARPAVELEFKHTEERDRQVAIVVGALLDKRQADEIQWVKKVLSDAEVERRSWEDAERARQLEEAAFDDEDDAAKEPEMPPAITVRGEDDARQTAVFRNPHLRLLMTLSGMRRQGHASEETRETPWTIPGDISADHLKDTQHFISQAEFNPPSFDDGKAADSQLRRKTAPRPPRKKAAFDDDGDDGDSAHGIDLDDFLDDGALFPAGGPTARRAIDAPAKKKTAARRRRKRDDDGDEGETEAAAEERRRKRLEREREKARKVKSALYVREGDDDFDSDEDEAFFAREREIASRAEMAAKSATGTTVTPVLPSSSKTKVNKIVDSDDDDDDDDDDDGDDDDLVLANQAVLSSADTDDDDDGGVRKRRRVSVEEEEEEEEEQSDVDMTVPAEKDRAEEGDDDDGEDEGPVLARRPRVRGGFVMDSDDE